MPSRFARTQCGRMPRAPPICYTLEPFRDLKFFAKFNGATHDGANPVSMLYASKEARYIASYPQIGGILNQPMDI